MQRFETIRHGDKGADGNLSEVGENQAIEKAEQIYQQITEAPVGSIIYAVPSSVGRAVQTRDILEERLRELCADCDDVVFVSVQDKEALEHVRAETDKKVVVVDIQPQRLIGFDAKTSYIPAWKENTARFGGNEYYTMLTWAALPDEIETVRAEVAEKIPIAEMIAIDPSRFVQTPEEEAIKYLRLSRRFSEISKKHFPDRTSISLQVGHNVADFATLALLGKQISAESIREVLAGNSRDFLESARFEERDGEMLVTYRDHLGHQEIRFDELIERLERESEERKSMWMEHVKTPME